jgi:hypothetical protein
METGPHPLAYSEVSYICTLDAHSLLSRVLSLHLACSMLPAAAAAAAAGPSCSPHTVHLLCAGVEVVCSAI